MVKRWGVVLTAAAVAWLAAPSTTRAGDAFLKLGLTFHPDVGGFTDRWFVSAGTDWGVNEMGYFGLEVQGAYRSNRAVGPALVDSVPANFFFNGKWKSTRYDVRPYAGLGFGLVSAYVRSEVNGVTETDYVKDGGFQFMGGVELNRKWLLELLGQRVFQEGAGFSWSFLGGINW